MNKQLKLIICMVVVLIALIGAYIAVKNYNHKEEGKQLMPETLSLITCEMDSITSYSYKVLDDEINLEYKDGTWVFQDRDEEVKQFIPNTQRRILSDVKYSEVIEGVTDLDQYGLVEPKITIKYNANGVDRVLYVGDYNITSELFYMAIPEEPDKVYIAKTTLFDNFSKFLNDLIVTSNN